MTGQGDGICCADGAHVGNHRHPALDGGHDVLQSLFPFIQTQKQSLSGGAHAIEALHADAEFVFNELRERIIIQTFVGLHGKLQGGEDFLIFGGIHRFCSSNVICQKLRHRTYYTVGQNQKH